MRFQVLDSWRGIAALLVALFHFRFLGHFYDNGFVRNGWLWVDFFFVLSGFVISHAYHRRLNSAGEIASFAVRRFGRLWPLHIAVLSAFFCMEMAKWTLVRMGALSDSVPPFAANDVYSFPSLLTNVLLVQSLDIHDLLTWNIPSWSVSTEFYVCLVFALACALRRRAFHVGVTVALIVSLGLVAHSGSYLNTTYRFGFFRCLMGFLTGHLTYSVFRGIPGHRIHLPTAIEIGAIAAVGLFIAILGRGSGTLGAPALFAIALYPFAREEGAVSALLRSKPFQKLGEWSYSIYMVHFLIFVVASRSLLVVERWTGHPLRVEHTAPSDLGPVDVFFFEQICHGRVRGALSVRSGRRRFVDISPNRGALSVLVQ